MFVISLAGGMVTPELPVYAVDTLGATLRVVGVVVAAPFVGLILVQPLAGYLGDHVGRRVLIVSGAVVTAAATLGYAFAPWLLSVIALRALTGAGSGLVIVGSLAVVVDDAPAAKRGERVSLYTLATNGGGALGPVIGAALSGPLSFGGVVAASAGVAGLGILGGTLGDLTRPARDKARPQLRTRAVFHSAAVAPGLLLALCFGGAAAMYTLLPIFVREVGVAGSGGAFAVFAASITIVRSAGRRLPELLGHARCVAVALGVIGGGLVIMALATSLAAVVVASAIIGFGHGFAYPSLATSVTLRCREDERATALAAFTALTMTGMALWSIGLGPAASALGMRMVFFLVGVAMVVTGTPLLACLRTRVSA